MGGTLYREWSAYWPDSADQPVADITNTTPKYVVSNTLDRVDWSNSTLISGDDVAGQIRQLADGQPGRHRLLVIAFAAGLRATSSAPGGAAGGATRADDLRLDRPRSPSATAEHRSTVHHTH